MIHFRHADYGEDFFLRARPEPCQGDSVVYRMPEGMIGQLKKHHFVDILVLDAHSVIIIPAKIEKIHDDAATFQLTKDGYAVNIRRAVRRRSQGIEVDLYQNAFLAKGVLIDFSSFGFRIQLVMKPLSSIKWLNTDAPVTVCLRKGDQVVFSSMCHCIRYSNENSAKNIVLAPLTEQLHQFQKKKIRNPRHRLVPQFEMVITHPFLGKKIRREIYDITTSGFSVLEETQNTTLLPGMVIRDFTIHYAGAFDLKCIAAQVMYRQPHRKGTIRYGIAILDMDIQTYSDLTNILSQPLEQHLKISHEVDLDDLWHFLFETGFIYPEKYRHICGHPEEFKQTYQKIYNENPEIARHFTYQKNGRIYGHISLIRAYEKTWMFQHLAAKSVDKIRSGIMLMKLIGHFVKELYRLPSAKMDYLMVYYRPQNRFSKRIFGGFAKGYKDSRVCSEDLFSYLIFTQANDSGKDLPENWILERFSGKHLWEFHQFYKHHSGGLLLNILHFVLKEKTSPESIEDTYTQLGLIRKMDAFALFYNGLLTAVILANQTNLGFNMSDLLNSIKVIICHPTVIPEGIFSTAIHMVMRSYNSDKIPVLVYPSSFIENKKSFREIKKYVMWILDARNVSEFMAFTKKKYKIGYWE
ncbi:hypothetical protein ACFL9U_01965 [Thermodesulfobacteriota bacterium]